MTLLVRMREWALSIDADDAKFSRLGFYAGDKETQARLEKVACVFVHGFNTSLHKTNLESLTRTLEGTPAELRGFAFEGASMGLTLMDCLTPWRRHRFSSFSSGLAGPHTCLVYIGAGLALARLRLGVDAFIARTDRLFGWLAADGYGFHDGFFRTDFTVRRKQVPHAIRGYASRAFDQGLGRSLWFIHCADVQRIVDCIAGFDSFRHSHLWSGVGLACAYAGGVSESTILSLRTDAGPYRSHVAQGAAFAALARQQAGNPASHTELACRILCGRSAYDAGALAEQESTDLPRDREIPGYEVWRRRVQHMLGMAWIRKGRTRRALQALHIEPRD